MDHAITIQLDMLGICFRKVNGNGEVTGEGRSVDPRVLQIDSMRLAVFEHARVSNICHFGTSSCRFPLLTTRYRSEFLACIIFRHLMMMFGRYICTFPEIFALVPGQLLADNAPKNPPQI